MKVSPNTQVAIMGLAYDANIEVRRHTERGGLDAAETVHGVLLDLAESEDLLGDDDVHTAESDVDLGSVVAHNCKGKHISTGNNGAWQSPLIPSHNPVFSSFCEP